MQTSFQCSEIEAVFDAYPGKVRKRMLQLRQLIFDTAAKIDRVGPIEEALKWGQPSYLTPKSKSGTTIRIDQIKSEPECYGLFVNCRTSLLSTYRELYGDILTYDGTRCLKFNISKKPSKKMISNCITIALTYHLDKRKDHLPF